MTEFWTWFLVYAGTGLSLFGLLYMLTYGGSILNRSDSRKASQERFVTYYGMLIGFIGQVMAFAPTVQQII